VIPLLFWTHPQYRDRGSRRAVQQCLVAICKRKDKTLLAPLVTAIHHETPKTGIASSSAFVLVEWCSLLIHNLAGTPLWSQFSKEVILSMSGALEKTLQSSSRPQVAHSALVVARRGIRSLLAKNKTPEKAVEEAVKALTVKSSVPTAKNAALLGVFAGVCARNTRAKPFLESLKPEYLTFYAREIIASKTPVPGHIANGLFDFFAAFVSIDDLEKEVFPALEKGLLRAPEIVLNDLFSPLVRPLPAGMDLSAALHGRLLKPMLSNVKSSNAAIRSGVLAAFQAISGRCADFSLTDKISDELLVPLKGGKLASPDQRILHCEMLVALRKSSSTASKVATGIASTAAKEGNEAALTAETVVLCDSIRLLLNDDGQKSLKDIIQTFAKGLAEKKLPFRRIWILATGELLNSFCETSGPLSGETLKLAEATLPPLLSSYDEVIANPITAAQNGLLSAALVVSTVAGLPHLSATPALEGLIKKALVMKTCVAVEPKPSFLLNPRVYSKLTAQDDLQWQCRALFAVFPHLPQKSSPSRLAWAQGIFYILSSAVVSPALRRETCQSLSSLYLSEPRRVASTLTEGIWHWLESHEAGDKESAAILSKSDNGNLHLALKAICLQPSVDGKKTAAASLENEAVEEQMCNLLVLARPVLVPRSVWIDLCLRASVDPGTLAQKYEKNLLREIAERTDPIQTVSCRRDARQSVSSLIHRRLVPSNENGCVRCGSRAGFCCTRNHDSTPCPTH
jgi:hypothetical protein